MGPFQGWKSCLIKESAFLCLEHPFLSLSSLILLGPPQAFFQKCPFMEASQLHVTVLPP